MPAKLTDLLLDSNAMGYTTLSWVLRYPAPRAGAAAERVRLDGHSLILHLIAPLAKIRPGETETTLRICKVTTKWMTYESETGCREACPPHC